MMNDDLKRKAFRFIIHHSSFIIGFYGSGAVVFRSGALTSENRRAVSPMSAIKESLGAWG
jgi:hypothetical protein